MSRVISVSHASTEPWSNCSSSDGRISPPIYLNITFKDSNATIGVDCSMKRQPLIPVNARAQM